MCTCVCPHVLVRRRRVCPQIHARGAYVIPFCLLGRGWSLSTGRQASPCHERITCNICLFMHPGGCTWVTAIVVTVVRGGGKTRQWWQHADEREMFQWHLELLTPEKKKKASPNQCSPMTSKKAGSRIRVLGLGEEMHTIQDPAQDMCFNVGPLQTGHGCGEGTSCEKSKQMTQQDMIVPPLDGRKKKRHSIHSWWGQTKIN